MFTVGSRQESAPLSFNLTFPTIESYSYSDVVYSHDSTFSFNSFSMQTELFRAVKPSAEDIHYKSFWETFIKCKYGPETSDFFRE